MWEWVDSGSVPSTGTAHVPTTGNGELGPLAPPLHAASDTGESCAWEYQHNTEQLPHSLYSTHQLLVYHSPQSTTNQTHTTVVYQIVGVFTVSFIPVIVEAISSSDSFCLLCFIEPPRSVNKARFPKVCTVHSSQNVYR